MVMWVAVPVTEAWPSAQRLAFRTIAFQRQVSELASTDSMGADTGDNRNTSRPPPVVLVAKILACNTLVSFAQRPSTPSR